ncbi:isoprenyl transferase [Algivirga pacifica]|uniref:Isoprenyl transferase n=1 Tax=Algivirga pacifica TaxID=1162670 RepID=A0ABP9CZ15_9BACT
MKENIDLQKIPNHIAVIMDGNGRWAKQKGAMRVFGHKNAIKAVRDITEGAAELGVNFLTLYAFSTENWNRPEREVKALMQLLVSTIKDETATLQKNNIRLNSIGDASLLPDKCQNELNEAIEATSNNTGMVLTLALSYSGRWDITQAIRKICQDHQAGSLDLEGLSEQQVSAYMSTGEIPDPELLIRTSGELRISNFLLWQMAYTEMYFTDVLWPDFRKETLYAALLDYQSRERRFGKTSEQLSSN